MPQTQGTVAGSVRASADVQETPLSTVLSRSLRLLTLLAQRSSPDVLSAAAGASTDADALLRLLESPSTQELLTTQDAMLSARSRGVEARRSLLEAEGGTLSADAVGRHLGISRQAVDKRRKAGSLLAIAIGRRGYAYPAWQLTDRDVLTGLRDVLQHLAGHDAWSRLVFFLTPNARLRNSTPLKKLRAGEVEGVVKAADAYLQQGAA